MGSNPTGAFSLFLFLFFFFISSGLKAGWGRFFGSSYLTCVRGQTETRKTIMVNTNSRTFLGGQGR